MAIPRQRTSSIRRIRLDSVVWTFILVLLAFYAGLFVGMKQSSVSLPNVSHSPDFELAVKRKVQDVLERRRKIDQENNIVVGDLAESRFGQATAHYAVGAARIDKQDFVETFDGGFPPDQGNPDPAASEVLLFYNSPKALPNLKREETISSESVPPKLTAVDATSNCQTLHVVSTKSALHQCVALIPRYESFHVDRWMRIDSSSGKLNNESPLVQVGRGQNSNGAQQFKTPSKRASQLNQKRLQTYIQHAPSTLDKLRPLLNKIAIDNTVVVMVCNRGQADLLANFACSNRARGLPLTGILVFCTDQETYDIATDLGLSAYFDNRIFGEISSSQAQEYGDKTFQQLMYAKVISIQLVNWLEFNVLFLDVDVVWYKHPVVFLNTAYPNFDVLFQEDGAQSARYSPYSANSGFYYVRYNDKTRHLLTRMLYAGDVIVASGSHQQALSVLLAEHSSLYGLRVKVLPGHAFPGGYQFHRNAEFMRDMLVSKKVESQPFVFHMSWTKSKEDKIKFLQQMGLWHVQDNGRLGIDSCSSEPLVTCHYRDKPSVEPCHDSPFMDKKGKPFWPSERKPALSKQAV